MRLAAKLARLRLIVIVAPSVLAAGCDLTPVFDDIGDIDYCAGADRTVARIGFDQTRVNLRVGFNMRVQAQTLNAQGQLVICGPAIVWSSSDATVATVSDGLVSAVGGGSAFIRASSGGITDSIPVTITASAVATVTIERVPPPLLIGQTAVLKLVARDNDGIVITPRAIAWQSDNSSVVSMSTTGLAIAESEGTATVTAVVEGVSATARIVVTRGLPVRRFDQIAAGGSHACALVGGGGIPEGTAYCWGRGELGQLGLGIDSIAVAPAAVGGGHTFSFIAAGDNTSCALTAAGEAYCWGSNRSGQLGDGTRTDQRLPVRVATTRAFTTLAAGGDVTCGLIDDGSAYCWGLLGNNIVTRTPTLLPGGIRFTELAGGGGGFICGRTSAGRAYCWGSVFTFAPATPALVPGNLVFSSISAGAAYACGVTMSDGAGYCWGRMDAYPLGSAISQGVHQTPVVVPGNLRLTRIAAGAGFACGVTSGGSYCLGNTGLSNATDASTPRRIPKDDVIKFASISAGSGVTCAIDPNEGGWCWGPNYAGQAGIGDASTNVTEPLQLRIP